LAIWTPPLLGIAEREALRVGLDAGDEREEIVDVAVDDGKALDLGVLNGSTNFGRHRVNQRNGGGYVDSLVGAADGELHIGGGGLARIKHDAVCTKS
jgi:hypothetical protein